MTLHSQIGAIANHATPEEAEKLAVLTKQIGIIELSLRKMQMTKVSLLHELDLNPGSTGKQAKLQGLYADINRYHSKIATERKKIIRIVQGIKWRQENKKRGLKTP